VYARLRFYISNIVDDPVMAAMAALALTTNLRTIVAVSIWYFVYILGDLGSGPDPAKWVLSVPGISI